MTNTTITMKTTALRSLGLVLAVFLMLSGCGGDSGTVTTDWQGQQTLVFGYPYPGQKEVPPSAELVLRFSAPLEDSVIENIDERLKLVPVHDGEEGEVVSYSATKLDNGRGLRLIPEDKLSLNTAYRLKLTEQGLGGVDASDFEDYRFRTAGPLRGRFPGSLQGFARGEGDADFNLLRVKPLDQTALLTSIEDASQPNDMSTLRLVFNRALDPASVQYGQQVELVDAQGGLVEARLLLQGRYLVLDPVQDLKAEEHTLKLSGLRSRRGEELAAIERAFTPVNTKPRETNILKVGTLGEQQPELASMLTGQDVNKVPVDSFILGNESFTKVSGDLAADLAYAPHFPDAVPLRIPAGSVLRGTPVDINILGKIPAGIQSGQVKVTLVSDANGYLIPNPFSDANDARRYAVLTMDAAMTAGKTIANAALSQNLLNIQVAGLAVVKDGVLVMDAVSIVEPNVLGLERASGMLSFHVESYADQRSAPVPEGDPRPFKLQSWSPGENFQINWRPGDPITLNFNKAVDAASVSRPDAIDIEVREEGGTYRLLTEQEQRERFPMRHDGGTVVIDGGNTSHSEQYRITLSTLLEDTQGKPLTQTRTLEFDPADRVLPSGSVNNLRAPTVIPFPGYACALTGKVLTGPREQWRNGRCVGSKASDIKFHVNKLYKDFPVRLVFNRTIDPATVNEDTFFVERRKSDGSWVRVPGRRQIQAQRVEFYPDDPWQIGALYRHTLKSTPDQSNVNCGVNAVCSPDGAPVQTRTLAQSPDNAPAPRQGGPDMVNHFTATGDENRYTLAGLRALPTADVNANMKLDPAEQGAVVLGENQDISEAPRQFQEITVDGTRLGVPRNRIRAELKSTSSLIVDAKLGCALGETCPEKKFLYLSSGMVNAGPSSYDPDVTVNRRLIDGDPSTDNKTTGAIRANVYPTILNSVGTSLEARIGALDIGLITIGLETGPLVIRLVPEEGEPFITGFITETPNGPWFNATFTGLIDAPELRPTLGPLEFTHDLRSKAVEITLEGPLRFVEDGRLVLKIQNPNDIDLQVKLDFLDIGGTILGEILSGEDALATATLRIPPKAIQVNLTFLPVKDF